MGLFDFLKKKNKISVKSANFAKWVKYFCFQSGIPLEIQLKITKEISNDFIEKKGKSLNDFFFLDDVSAKDYLIKKGMNSLDAEIFWSILKNNSASFLQSA